MGAAGRLGPPPEQLPALPEVRLGPDPLATIHRDDASPWRIHSRPEGRFNLAAPRGTCYAAEDPLGAFVEVFARFEILDEREVARYRLSYLATEGRRLADLTHRRVLGVVGLTAEIHSTIDYGLTRAWSEAFCDAGYEGVRYKARHDPAGKLTSCALFGTQGEPGPDVVSTKSLSAHLLSQAEREFGLVVAPRRVRRR